MHWQTSWSVLLSCVTPCAQRALPASDIIIPLKCIWTNRVKLMGLGTKNGPMRWKGWDGMNFVEASGLLSGLIREGHFNRKLWYGAPLWVYRQECFYIVTIVIQYMAVLSLWRIVEDTLCLCLSGICWRTKHWYNSCNSRVRGRQMRQDRWNREGT